MQKLTGRIDGAYFEKYTDLLRETAPLHAVEGKIAEFAAYLDGIRHLGFIAHSTAEFSLVYVQHLLMQLVGPDHRTKGVDSVKEKQNAFATQLVWLISPEQWFKYLHSTLMRYWMTSEIPHFRDSELHYENDVFFQNYLYKVLRSATTIPAITNLAFDSALYDDRGFARYPELCPQPGLPLTLAYKAQVERALTLAAQNFSDSTQRQRFLERLLSHQSYLSSFALNVLNASVPTEKEKTLRQLLSLRKPLLMNARKYPFGSKFVTDLLDSWQKDADLERPFSKVINQVIAQAADATLVRIGPLLTAIGQFVVRKLQANLKPLEIFQTLVRTMSFSASKTADRGLKQANIDADCDEALQAIKQATLRDWFYKVVYGWSKTWIAREVTNRPDTLGEGSAMELLGLQEMAGDTLWTKWIDGFVMGKPSITPAVAQEAKGTMGIHARFVKWLQLMLLVECERAVEDLFIELNFVTYTRQITARSVGQQLFVYANDKYHARETIDYHDPVIAFMDEVDMETAHALCHKIALDLRLVLNAVEEDAELYDASEPGFEQFDNRVQVIPRGYTYASIRSHMRKTNNAAERFHRLFWIIRTDAGFYAMPKRLFRYTADYPFLEIGAAKEIAKNPGAYMEQDYDTPVPTTVRSSSAIPVIERTVTSDYPIIDEVLLNSAPDLLIKTLQTLNSTQEGHEFDFTELLDEIRIVANDEDDPVKGNGPIVNQLYPEQLAQAFMRELDKQPPLAPLTEEGRRVLNDINFLIAHRFQTRQMTFPELRKLAKEIVMGEDVAAERTSTDDALNLAQRACNHNLMRFREDFVKLVGNTISITQALLCARALFLRLLQILSMDVIHPSDDNQKYIRLHQNMSRLAETGEDTFISTIFKYDDLPFVKRLDESKQAEIVDRLNEAPGKVRATRPDIVKYIRELTVATTHIRANEALLEIVPLEREIYPVIGHLMLVLQQSMEGLGGPHAFCNMESIFDEANYCLEFLLMAQSSGSNCLHYELGNIAFRLINPLALSYFKLGNGLRFLELCMLTRMLHTLMLEIKQLIAVLPPFPKSDWENVAGLHPATMLKRHYANLHNEEVVDGMVTKFDQLQLDADGARILELWEQMINAELNYAMQIVPPQKK